MMRIREWAAIALLYACVACMGRAEALAIQSFDGAGRLTFSELATATVYRVEWASAPTGPWLASSPGVKGIAALGSGQGVATVGLAEAACFFRVVAAVTNTAPLLAVPSGMALIPAGVNRGTDPDYGAYILTLEAPVYVDACEVTKEQWDVVYVWAVTNGYGFDGAGRAKEAGHPVQSVSWYDCVKWCNARSEKEGRSPAYFTDSSKAAVYRSGHVDIEDNCVSWTCGYRLPTDAEWEYAARGGVSGKRFPWGDTIDHDKANYYGWPSGCPYDMGYAGFDIRYNWGIVPYTSPVGSFAQNGYGLYDTVGNVWEWCWEWFPGFEGSKRILRGGCAHFTSPYEVFASRLSQTPDYRFWPYGFRSVLPAVRQ